MIRMLKADFIRLRTSFAYRLSLIGMLVLASAFMFIQATAMDYSVPLSRVVFLPLSLYGIVMASFVSVFIGADFSDGIVRNKLLTAKKRSSLVISQIIVSCTGCIIVYIVVTVFSAGIGHFFFENDVISTVFIQFFTIGIGMSIVIGCLFSVVTMICGNKTQAIILCMILAFGMFFVCLHTNQVLIQTEYKNGVPNPHYVGGIRRQIYSILHDINPCGQAAQLSAWNVWHPIRVQVMNLFVIVCASALGCLLFRRKDVR